MAQASQALWQSPVSNFDLNFVVLLSFISFNSSPVITIAFHRQVSTPYFADDKVCLYRLGPCHGAANGGTFDNRYMQLVSSSEYSEGEGSDSASAVTVHSHSSPQHAESYLQEQPDLLASPASPVPASDDELSCQNLSLREDSEAQRRRPTQMTECRSPYPVCPGTIG